MTTSMWEFHIRHVQADGSEDVERLDRAELAVDYPTIYALYLEFSFDELHIRSYTAGDVSGALSSEIVVERCAIEADEADGEPPTGAS